MSTLNFRKAATLFTLGLLALWAAFSTEARAQAQAVDPDAVKILQRMPDSKPGQRAAAPFPLMETVLFLVYGWTSNSLFVPGGHGEKTVRVGTGDEGYDEKGLERRL